MANPPPGMSRDDFIQAVDHAIRARKTAKISGDVTNCLEQTDAHQERIREAVTGIIEAAGWSPYHKAAHKMHLNDPMTSPVPWRFYVLDKTACCGLLNAIRSQAETNSDPKWERAMLKRIPRLLAGTDVLIQVTWLPEPANSGDVVEFSHRNIEHVAAASAAIQNLMLAAEARGMHTYWSSGGILRESILFDMMG
ncbi:MAG: nitroreductase family protein, partial [Aggregatilineales bacterium]